MSKTALKAQDMHRLLVIHLRASADIMEMVAKELEDLDYHYSARALRGQVTTCREAIALAERKSDT